jgi:thioredoxin-dependent peroxiredoxin
MTNMKLRKGEQVPEFDVKDVYGNLVSSKGFKGRKVLISFYRYASCPLCNLRVHELITEFNDLERKGLNLIALFQSPKNSILSYVGKQKPPFPIIPDPERNIYKLFGVEENSKIKFFKGIGKIGKFRKASGLGFKGGTREGAMYLVPADFLIDEEGIIQEAYYGKDISDHISLDSIRDFLKNQDLGGRKIKN